MMARALLFGLLVLSWTFLVWINWFRANPVDFGQVGSSLAAFVSVSPGPALKAAGGIIPRLFLLIVLGVAALAAGRPLVRCLRGQGRPYSAALALALGAGALGLGTLGAGFAGLAYPSLAWVAAVALAVVPAATTVSAATLAIRLRPANFKMKFPVRDFWLMLPIGAVLVLSLTGALAPEATFDGQVHHLAHPQIYAFHHKVCPLSHHFLANYPALTEMQYLLAWLLSGGPEAAKLVHYAWGILTFAILLGWAREKLEEPYACAAAAAFIAIPYVQLVSMWAYVDLAAAGYLTLVLRLASGRRARPVALGILCGLCAGTKVTGVFAPVLAGAALALRRVPARYWAAFLASSFLLAVPWGLRNLCLAGNPFAPFLSDLFPTLWWGPGNMARYQAELASYRGGPEILRGVLGTLAGPWNVSVRNVGVLDSMGGMGGWFIWGFPLLALVRAPAARGPFLLAMGYFALWHLVPQQVRYLLPVWPCAVLACALIARALIASGGLAAWSGRALGLVLALTILQAVQRQNVIGNPVRVVAGSESEESYLARGIPGRGASLKARAWLTARQGPTDVLLTNHYGLGFFWGPRAIRQSFFDTPLIERFARESKAPADIGKRLKQYGIGLVLHDSQGGFEMQSIYGMYGFDSGSAKRWLSYWTREARIQANLDDQYLFYRLVPFPGLKAPEGMVSAWPGLDDQWLAGLEMKLTQVERGGGKREDLKELEKGYARVARESGSPFAWERLGLMRLKLEDWARARAALAEASNRGRSSALLYDGLGLVEAMAGRWNEAARAFAAALMIKPGHTNARVNLARVYLKFGKKKEALKLVREGLMLEPGSSALNSLLRELSRSP